MSDLRKENKTGEVIDEQIGGQDGGFSNMWSQKGRATFSTAAGALNVICIPRVSSDFFLFFPLLPSFPFFFFPRGAGVCGLESGRGVLESPDCKSLATCGVKGAGKTNV